MFWLSAPTWSNNSLHLEGAILGEGHSHDWFLSPICVPTLGLL